MRLHFSGQQIAQHRAQILRHQSIDDIEFKPRKLGMRWFKRFLIAETIIGLAAAYTVLMLASAVVAVQ